MPDHDIERRQIQATVEALVKLHDRSAQARRIDKDNLDWQPSEESCVSLGEQRPIRFINNLLTPANVPKTPDIRVYTSVDSLGEYRWLDISGKWEKIEPLLLLDGTPVMVKANNKLGQDENLLKVLRVVQKDGVRKLYHVDILQAGNLIATENPLSATEITDENSSYVYPAVVRVKDLRKEYKGIGPKIQSKIIGSLLRHAHNALDIAENEYLRSVIAKVQEQLWPPPKTK